MTDFVVGIIQRRDADAGDLGRAADARGSKANGALDLPYVLKCTGGCSKPGRFPMLTRRLLTRMTALFSVTALAAALSNPAMAHCDSMDGPVVKDAQRAIAAKNVTPVLKWVREGDEDQIRSAFEMTLAVRGESTAARAVADRYFFETLIRVHRASEGEGFTGLKPAGSVDPAIAAADRALADGNIDRLADELATAVRHAAKERFAEAHEKREAAEKSVTQGREYVAAYVQFTHFIESTHNLVAAGASHKHRENKGEH